jgi:hypothetical protein
VIGMLHQACECLHLIALCHFRLGSERCRMPSRNAGMTFSFTAPRRFNQRTGGESWPLWFASKFAGTCPRAPLAVRAAICVFALLVLAAIPLAASADGGPIVVDANATPPCVKPAAPPLHKHPGRRQRRGRRSDDSGLPRYAFRTNYHQSALTLRGVTVPNANNGTGEGAATITAPAVLVTNAAYAGTTTPAAAQGWCKRPMSSWTTWELTVRTR